MKSYGKGAAWYDVLSIGLPGELEFYLREAKKAKGRVLEAACGTGRIYLKLLEAGVDAYGFDLSPDMLRVLKEKGRGLGTKVKKADMRTFRYPFRFDLIMIPYNAFLHLETREDQKRCLRNIRRHLRKGGRLILNIFDPKMDYLAEIDRKKITSVKSGRRLRVENVSHYDIPNQRIESYHRILNPRPGFPREKMEFTLTYIFPREFMNMLELCGFRRWELYGGFRREPYAKNGQNLVWIAYK